MHYQKYHSIDVVNGPGTRCTLFLSGCEHQCRGCYNKATWRCDAGFEYTLALQEQIIADLNDSRIKRRGLSLSGGDPLHPANLAGVLALVQHVKARCPGKDIWLWTGYTLNQLSPAQREIVALVDTLIDGRFEQDLADPNLQWRGSSNQIIHYQPLARAIAV